MFKRTLVLERSALFNWYDYGLEIGGTHGSLYSGLKIKLAFHP